MYLTKTFDVWDGTYNSILSAYEMLLGIIGLFIVLPIVSRKFHVHDAFTLTVISALFGVGTIVQVRLLTALEYVHLEYDA